MAGKAEDQPLEAGSVGPGVAPVDKAPLIVSESVDRMPLVDTAGVTSVEFSDRVGMRLLGKGGRVTRNVPLTGAETVDTEPVVMAGGPVGSEDPTVALADTAGILLEAEAVALMDDDDKPDPGNAAPVKDDVGPVPDGMAEIGADPNMELAAADVAAAEVLMNDADPDTMTVP